MRRIARKIMEIARRMRDKIEARIELEKAHLVLLSAMGLTPFWRAKVYRHPFLRGAYVVSVWGPLIGFACVISDNDVQPISEDLRKALVSRVLEEVIDADLAWQLAQQVSSYVLQKAQEVLAR